MSLAGSLGKPLSPVSVEMQLLMNRWGWLVFTLGGIGVVVLIAVVSVGWWWMTRNKRDKYEPLEGEDDDS
jgi:hypothetical protein